MTKTFKNLVCILFLTLGFLVVPVTQAQAQTSAWANNCVADDQGNLGSGDVATIQGFECLVANVLSIFVSLIGLAGFVMLLVGSFQYLISGGNAKGTETARNTITFAVVGLVVALSAFIVINLIAEFTGVDIIKRFTIQVENNPPQNVSGDNY